MCACYRREPARGCGGCRSIAPLPPGPPFVVEFFSLASWHVKLSGDRTGRTLDKRRAFLGKCSWWHRPWQWQVLCHSERWVSCAPSPWQSPRSRAGVVFSKLCRHPVGHGYPLSRGVWVPSLGKGQLCYFPGLYLSFEVRSCSLHL